MPNQLHPFDSIQDYEITLAAKLIKDGYNPADNVHFVLIDRLEPPKRDTLKYLEAEKAGKPLPEVPRTAYAYFYTKQKHLHKALVNLTYKHVITTTTLPHGTVGPLLPEDVIECESWCMEHPLVQAEVEKLQLPPGYVVRTDPWMYGTDSEHEDRFLIQYYMYLVGSNGHEESNHYSLPLKFAPVFEAFTKKFVRIDFLPGGVDEKVTATLPWKEVLPVEYHYKLHGEKPRDLKPLLYVQPEGVSYEIEGSKVKWQGWEFRVSSNNREGMVIYDASFKGRSVLYRLSLSEMTVPYGDPRVPFHRKQAFDLGDCGFGSSANSLALGCDCLGVIKYLDCLRCDGEGNPVLIPSTICMHEQDDGLLYKHVNYRTFDSTQARRREFVLQTIATVANYEYILNIVFDQIGQISIKAKATGILSTMPIDEGLDVPWGTNVGPGVMAAYHQHLLSFRIDPAVDGHNNTVVYDDAVPMAIDPVLNPYGIGFVSERTVVEKAGYIEQSPFTNRAVKIINESVINPTTRKPVAYKIDTSARQMMIAHPTSFNSRRAKYATQQMWVVPYKDNQLWAAGEFTNQSQTDTGLAEWVKGEAPVRNTDLVVFATMSLTHLPRAEDFPVMPTDNLPEINIIPYGFFEKNPGLDVPQSDNKGKNSMYYEESKKQSTAQNSDCCKKASL
ncbi:hypothetical protein BABINDRAFT_31123 [Babjeviella inositovora NRRL Y-12698]|uniref:Amine oxidase n=1 Tax=Babjeviella inositovora NRRL Y-12698 TaxID=984486 RepID=A0A1E3QZN9_9ASCO|nr:uncharacterized protein BABINDRAFT_31123 [Babjeviella inositovora NRRL Y-12698]ODQ83116.1 hypothetical protein BABINDRAFT_31123 [Babjeviella inositovora NRRL Y-12698]